MLGSTMVFTGNIGILIVFFFGNYSDFFMAPKFVIIVAILFVISFSYFPETPSFLIKQNKIAVSNNTIYMTMTVRYDTHQSYILLNFESSFLVNLIR